jgi:hypothetical protein
MTTFAGIPPAFHAKLGNMSGSVWPGFSREVAENPRASAPELARLRGKGTRSAIWAAGHRRVEIKDIRGLETIAQLVQSVRLEGSAVEQLGDQFPRVQRLPVQFFTIARFCKQTSGGCHPPVNYFEYGSLKLLSLVLSIRVMLEILVETTA